MYPFLIFNACVKWKYEMAHSSNISSIVMNYAHFKVYKVTMKKGCGWKFKRWELEISYTRICLFSRSFFLYEETCFWKLNSKTYIGMEGRASTTVLHGIDLIFAPFGFTSNGFNRHSKSRISQTYFLSTHFFTINNLLFTYYSHNLYDPKLISTKKKHQKSSKIYQRNNWKINKSERHFECS